MCLRGLLTLSELRDQWAVCVILYLDTPVTGQHATDSVTVTSRAVWSRDRDKESYAIFAVLHCTIQSRNMVPWTFDGVIICAL